MTITICNQKPNLPLHSSSMGLCRKSSMINFYIESFCSITFYPTNQIAFRTYEIECTGKGIEACQDRKRLWELAAEVCLLRYVCLFAPDCLASQVWNIL